MIRACGDDARVAYPLFQGEKGGSIPTSPLQLQIIPIGLSRAKKLNELWHSRLPLYETGFCEHAKICFGALYKNIFYAIGWKIANYSRKDKWNRPNRNRPDLQKSFAPKIRWEKELKLGNSTEKTQGFSSKSSNGSGAYPITEIRYFGDKCLK